jgi:hypothetical protein
MAAVPVCARAFVFRKFLQPPLFNHQCLEPEDHGAHLALVLAELSP